MSTHCYSPKEMLPQLLEMVKKEKKIKVFYSNVVKHVETSSDGERIVHIDTIFRKPIGPEAKGSTPGYNRSFSEAIYDWYSPSNSKHFEKSIIRFSGYSDRPVTFIDATEFGDVLALAEAPHLTGFEKMEGLGQPGNSQCGMAMVFPFAAKIHGQSVQQKVPKSKWDTTRFSLNKVRSNKWNNSFEQAWNYRRIFTNQNTITKVANGDISLINWYPGNDYLEEYVYLSPEDTVMQLDDWKGGVKRHVLRSAEKQSYAFFHWLRTHPLVQNGEATTPDGRSLKNRIAWEYGIFGTKNGMAKFPYMRDSRRSVGMNGYILSANDITLRKDELKNINPNIKTGKTFPDRVGLLSYSIDTRTTKGCTGKTPQHIRNYNRQPLPYFLPYRALTNQKVKNLLLAGKTMAQSYLVNASSRVHTGEWVSGIAAGHAAGFINNNKLESTHVVLKHITALQKHIRKYSPIDWTIEGRQYPLRNQHKIPVALANAMCPNGSWFMDNLGFCTDGNVVYGPFTAKMIENCTDKSVCTGPQKTQLTFPNGAKREAFIRIWDIETALTIRGGGDCPPGSIASQQYHGHCVDSRKVNGKNVNEVYGPFRPNWVKACKKLNGGSSCYLQRWSSQTAAAVIKRL